jgi:phage gpG-like protein
MADQNREATLRTQALVKALGQLAGSGKTSMQKALGETAISQAALGIRQSVNPYGDPFAPLTSRTGIPLRNTGNNIQRSWTAGQETPTSFVFGSRFKYLATHQYGATIVPVRAKMLRFTVAGAPKVTKSGRYRAGSTAVRYALKVVIPRRQMVPEESTGGLGPRWTRAFERTIQTYLRKLFVPSEGQ